MSSSLVPLKTRRGRGGRCTLNLSLLKRPSVGVEVRRRDASSGVILVARLWFKSTRSVTKSPRVAEQCDVNIHSLAPPGCLLYQKDIKITIH
ncbi:hypothetical protein TNCV_3521251 [Trichonephila clavipes]|nr:hypothetical protein TNCV_3521251 [Trichonephila clavipes]